MAVRVFTSYAYKDALLVEDLKKRLQLLRIDNSIELWDDLEVAPGGEWNYQVDTHMREADIILLMISPDFLASDYCYSIEMQKALERHGRGEAQIIPVLLRPVVWTNTPFAKNRALPEDGKPVTLWRNRDAALSQIVKGIHEVVRQISSKKQAFELQPIDASLSPSLESNRSQPETTANVELIALLKQGSEVWNHWREQQVASSRLNLTHVDLNGADLSGVNLNSAHLTHTNLRKADLHGANLSGANLSYTNLSRADLSGADLSGANLSDADLSNADLNDADLSYTDLSRANLSGAHLRSAHLRGASLYEGKIRHTVFAELDLRSVKGLMEVKHLGSSHIELHTVQLNQDGSTLHFLRGAGVPDNWIDFYRSEMMYPIEYHSCFISYSSRDVTLAQRLHADLQDRGVRCWFAPGDMKIGDQIRSRIEEAIHLQDKVLLLLSEHAIVSDWIANEVEMARQKELQQQREVVFPVRLDDAIMRTDQEWAITLRSTRHIGDFTSWTDPQAYQQAFERLLRDLKKADE